MKLIWSVAWAALLDTAFTTAPYSQANISSRYPLHDNGINKVVQWDHYSFKINGKRLFVFSGELHYWRIPVPEVWDDLLEKIKAAGFTAFAFYGNWAWHSATKETLDFETGAHNFERLLEAAKRVGLYVIVRPGPYVNAETNAGGFPLWLTTGAYGSLRNDDVRYTAAWKPYVARFSEITSRHLITNGGNAIVYQIENEYGEQWINSKQKVPNPAAARYMQALEETARDNGIDVPLIHNDPNLNTKSWSQDYAPNATGNVDVAGLDSYPSCWSCNLDECTGTNGEYVPYQVIDYYDHFQEVSPTQPSFFPEFQGGSYNPWGGPEGGCPADIGADFANLFYRNLISQRVTAISLYMMYGGTNWGALACPVVATSYDYSSPISENRQIGSKYYETKNLALFTRIADDLTITDRIANSVSYSTNPAIVTSELRNPKTNSAFYIAIHNMSSSGTRESFKLHVSTSTGNLTIPQYGGDITINGHQSKVIVTDFSLGSIVLTYSTAEILTYALIDGHPTVVLWVPEGESTEFHVKGAKKGSVEFQGPSEVVLHKDRHGMSTSFKAVNGKSVIHFDNGLRVVVVDRVTSYLFWAPNLSQDPSGPVDKSVLVHGPYLVRSITSEGGTLKLNGDTSNTTEIEVFASSETRSIHWNGKPIHLSRTTYGTFKGVIQSPHESIVLPSLASWKVHDSLPERFPGYDDSGPAWVHANHTVTPNPTKPLTLPVLYVDDYGFHNSFHIFRGYFSGSATGVNLTLQGGMAFGFSAWLNGAFIGSYLGNSTIGKSSLIIPFGNVTLSVNETNVLLVVQDNTGHDLRAAATDPRGILGAALQGGHTFTKWRIAGEVNGERQLIDPVRGPLSEGGMAAERLGWHLPGFDDSVWETSSPSVGFTGAGIYFYRTIMPLDVSEGVDAAFSFILSAPASKAVRIQLFVNGYQYGRFNPFVGNEIRFPVPPGILDYSGNNVVGLSVWAQTEEGARVDIKLQQDYSLESSWSPKFDSQYLRPGWTNDRLQYA